MSDAWGMLLALLAFVLPIGLAWVLVGRSARRRPPAARERRDSERQP